MGVWIEISSQNTPILSPLMSHPLWVCGLKWQKSRSKFQQCLSHPLWVCGLKFPNQRPVLILKPVTPFMGVWIEMFCSAGE